MERVKERIDQFGRARVLVVGDVVLDEYLYGTPTRLSREAPIPVLEFERRATIPGGAANPAHNIAAIGGTVRLASVVGDDAEGRQLRRLVQESGANVDCVLTDPTRPTTVKTRIVSGGILRFPQQVARIDRISRDPASPGIVASLGALVNTCALEVDAVLCSDYLSGLLTRDLVATIKSICRDHHLLLTVDAQGELDKYAGAGLLRCNDHEAAAFLQTRLDTEDDFTAGLERIMRTLEVELVVVTRGRDGVSLLGRTVPYTHLPAHRVEVADVTGAGDTFISVMTLGLATGAAPLDAAAIANLAAALVVQRIGNAVVTPDELSEAATDESGEKEQR